ncbi:MAG TPA: hypothetical protein VGM16_04575 [Gammaproteobacteria bacterium]|jgi:DnaJ-class molecular chaperone
MQADLDIEACRWCKGDGKDHGTLGMPVVRDCPRCEGSGRVYVTSKASATGRRRVYKGAAPKPGVVAAQHQQELTEALQKPKRGNHTKHARSHAA